jgi:hypothetical protein
MLLKKNFDNRALFVAGTTIIALRSVLQRALDRSGHTSDFTDFTMGMLFGVGLGILLLFVWRLRSDHRGSRHT